MFFEGYRGLRRKVGAPYGRRLRRAGQAEIVCSKACEKTENGVARHLLYERAKSHDHPFLLITHFLCAAQPHNWSAYPPSRRTCLRPLATGDRLALMFPMDRLQRVGLQTANRDASKLQRCSYRYNLRNCAIWTSDSPTQCILQLTINPRHDKRSIKLSSRVFLIQYKLAFSGTPGLIGIALFPRL